jgi:hypothetical protein
MKPIDYRDETWESLQGRLHGDLLRALTAWRIYGPGTTREVAQRSGIDLLTFRPRTTDLCHLGFVSLVDDAAPAREGRYRALLVADASALFAERQRAARAPLCQPELKLATA